MLRDAIEAVSRKLNAVDEAAAARRALLAERVVDALTMN
jgi:hypothetical protein